MTELDIRLALIVTGLLFLNFALLMMIYKESKRIDALERRCDL